MTLTSEEELIIKILSEHLKPIKIKTRGKDYLYYRISGVKYPELVESLAKAITAARIEELNLLANAQEKVEDFDITFNRVLNNLALYKH